MGETEWVRGRCEARGLPVPELREVDTWIIRLWREIVGRMGAGRQPEVLAMRCRWAGLVSEAEQAEVWERVSMLEMVSHG